MVVLDEDAQELTNALPPSWQVHIVNGRLVTEGVCVLTALRPGKGQTVALIDRNGQTAYRQGIPGGVVLGQDDKAIPTIKLTSLDIAYD